MGRWGGGGGGEVEEMKRLTNSSLVKANSRKRVGMFSDRTGTSA